MIELNSETFAPIFFLHLDKKSLLLFYQLPLGEANIVIKSGFTGFCGNTEDTLAFKNCCSPFSHTDRPIFATEIINIPRFTDFSQAPRHELQRTQ